MKGDGDKPAVDLVALVSGSKGGKPPPKTPEASAGEDDEEPDARLAAKQMIRAIDNVNAGALARAFRALHAATCPACAGEEASEGEDDESEGEH